MIGRRKVYGVRVRDKRGVLWNGDWHRVRTAHNPAGQWASRKNAEYVLGLVLENYGGHVVGHAFEQTIEPPVTWREWLLGDVVDPAHVPGQYRPDYDDTLQRAAHAAKVYGEPVYVSDSFRTRAEQEERWAAYQAGGPLAAPPGSSDHEHGVALDVPNARATPKLIKALRAQGLKDIVPSEGWHVVNVAAKG